MKKQTRLMLKRGMHKIPGGLRYKVLALTQLKPEDKKIIAKELAKVITPRDAKALISPDTKWGYKAFGSTLSLEGGVITYRGVEIALLYKRATTDVIPELHDPAPEGWLEHPEDVWVRFDLNVQSARETFSIVKADLIKYQRELALMDSEIDSLNGVVAAKEHTIRILEGKIKKAESALKRKKINPEKVYEEQG